MSENKVTNELELMTTIVVAEQNNFWLRFTAFSALNAAMVVAAISIKNASYVGYMGLVLSVFWTSVQWASYNYVVHYDETWGPRIEELGFRRPKEFWAKLPRTTFVGALTATLSMVFWIAFICKLV
ncbi:hypothetical protein [Emcibacter nanhaiensis]|uniref:Uncharacterized protein n=1 Tax=Emcibacter nanhaiensis TaxID=1505037 RepID=A0A501PVC4_9PROT|nr:hypothetical protein [Emcibacter nanhaiensis]TPD64002.1 hypothetical protein FIV46_00050 [Emcibacter nanhaiensis]